MKRYKVIVEEPLSAIHDQVEVVCPDVVLPGEFFNCHIDIPRGSSLLANVTLIDDINGQPETTGQMAIPGTLNEESLTF